MSGEAETYLAEGASAWHLVARGSEGRRVLGLKALVVPFRSPRDGPGVARGPDCGGYPQCRRDLGKAKSFSFFF